MQDDIVKQPPETPNPVSDVTPPPQENSSKPESSEQSTAPVVEEKPVESSESQPKADQAAPAPQKQKSNKPIGAIAAAVIVCLVLISGAVYVGVLKKDPETSKTNQQTGTPQNSKQEAASELDTALNEASQLPTDQSNPGSELTDQNLGL